MSLSLLPQNNGKIRLPKKKKSTLWQLKLFSFVFFYKSDAAFFIEEMKFEKKKGFWNSNFHLRN